MDSVIDMGSIDNKLDLLNPVMSINPFPTYAHLRDNKPVCQMAQGDMLAISRYSDVVFALQNPGIFSSTGIADALVPPWLADRIESKNYILALEDDPEHRNHKKLISKAFTYGAIERLAPLMKSCAERLLDNLRSNKCSDFITAVAYPYSENNINCFLGIEHHERYPNFYEWSQLLDMPPPCEDLEYLDRLRVRIDDISKYCDELILSRRQTRKKDFISALLDADPDNKIINAEDKRDLIEILFRASLLLLAHLLTHAILRLSQDNTLIQQLKASPEQIAAFIDELLRYDTPGHFLPRRTLFDVSISGVTISKNTKVYLLLGAANRDPRQFVNPDTFDISRPNNNSHVALGWGIHRYMGQMLIRAQLAAFIKVLINRYSAITCPPPDELDWVYSLSIYSMTKLPVQFD